MPCAGPAPSGRASCLIAQPTWLLAHKVLLPGCTTLERFVARLRNRVEDRLWKRLGRGVTDEQRTRLEDLLTVPPQGRSSWLDQLRSGPVRVSGRALAHAIQRLQTVRDLGIRLPATARSVRAGLALLARFAGDRQGDRHPAAPRRCGAWPPWSPSSRAWRRPRRTTQSKCLEMLLHELFAEAVRADQKARLRTLKDLDQAALCWPTACRLLFDAALPDSELRNPCSPAPRPRCWRRRCVGRCAGSPAR